MWYEFEILWVSSLILFLTSCSFCGLHWASKNSVRMLNLCVACRERRVAYTTPTLKNAQLCKFLMRTIWWMQGHWNDVCRCESPSGWKKKTPCNGMIRAIQNLEWIWSCCGALLLFLASFGRLLQGPIEESTRLTWLHWCLCLKNRRIRRNTRPSLLHLWGARQIRQVVCTIEGSVL